MRKVLRIDRLADRPQFTATSKRAMFPDVFVSTATPQTYILKFFNGVLFFQAHGHVHVGRQIEEKMRTVP